LLAADRTFADAGAIGASVARVLVGLFSIRPQSTVLRWGGRVVVLGAAAARADHASFGSASERLMIWQDTIGHINLFGHGLGHFREDFINSHMPSTSRRNRAARSIRTMNGSVPVRRRSSGLGPGGRSRAGFSGEMDANRSELDSSPVSSFSPASRCPSTIRQPSSLALCARGILLGGLLSALTALSIAEVYYARGWPPNPIAQGIAGFAGGASSIPVPTEVS